MGGNMQAPAEQPASAATEVPAEQQEAEKKIVAKFQEMREEKQKIAAKIAEMNTEKNEHEMVVKTLTPMDPNRKAWRMVGGVLVERTCGEVLPAVQEGLGKITEVVETLTKKYDDQEADIKAFMEKYNIRLQGPGGPPPTQQVSEE